MACLLFLLSAGFIYADRMGSSNYDLQFTNINIGGRTTSSSNYTLDISLGQTASKKWAENNYIIKAGFQYVHILYPFTFTLSSTTLDFGTLIPNSPKEESLTATISHRGQGYEVMVYQDHKLQTFDGGSFIENTTCDDPYCDEDTAEEWTLDSTTGFGYNVTGHDYSLDFLTSDYFRPFSTTPMTFMESNEAAYNRQSIIKTKVNIDATQPVGTYQTVLRFLAVPKY